jgi:hypothetical protein
MCPIDLVGKIHLQSGTQWPVVCISRIHMGVHFTISVVNARTYGGIDSRSGQQHKVIRFGGAFSVPDLEL